MSPFMFMQAVGWMGDLGGGSYWAGGLKFTHVLAMLDTSYLED